MHADESTIAFSLQEWLRRNDPARIIVIGYLFVVATGTILLLLPVSQAPGVTIGVMDALFTSTSATAVTGLTVIPTGESFSQFGQVVIMILIQVGGLGLMTMVTIFAVVLGWRIGIHHRVLVELDLNHISLSGIVSLVKQVTLFTLVFELIGAALLYSAFQVDMPLGQAAYFAVFHSVSAFCNAGFDLFGDSLLRYVFNPTVNMTIAGLFILGGLGFAVLQDLARNRRWHRLSFHSKIVISTSTVLTLGAMVLVLAVERGNPLTLGALSFPEQVLPAFFQAVTTRTAGFNTIPTELLALPTLFLFLVLMFVGASPGSTGGGIKTTTAATFLAVILSAIRRKKDVEMGKFRLSNTSLEGALLVVLGAFSWILLVTFALLWSEGTEFMTTLFEVVSAMGTVGLSLGLTPDLSSVGKALIILTMFVGRVGPIALVLSLGHRPTYSLIRRPEKRIIVG